MRKLAATVLMIALSVPPSFAFADASTAADIYRTASEAYQRGSFAEAASLLEKAFLEDQNLIYKYNQILAYMGAQNHAEALRVLNQHADAMQADGRFDDIGEIRQQLETTLAEQEKAEQEKLAADSTPTDYEKTGDSLNPPPETPSESSSPNYLAWSLVGVGGAAMISSALFFNHVFAPDEGARYADVRKHAKSMKEDDAWDKVYQGNQALADSDVETLNSQRMLGKVMLGTGIVLAGTGLALWYFDIPGGSSEKGIQSNKINDSNTLNVRLSPFFSTESAGASVHLKF